MNIIKWPGDYFFLWWTFLIMLNVGDMKRRMDPPTMYCQWPALAEQRMMTFSSTWPEPHDISRATIKQVLSLALTVPTKAVVKIGEHNRPSSGLRAWATGGCPPHANIKCWWFQVNCYILIKQTEQDCSILLSSSIHRHQKEL